MKKRHFPYGAPGFGEPPVRSPISWGFMPTLRLGPTFLLSTFLASVFISVWSEPAVAGPHVISVWFTDNDACVGFFETRRDRQVVWTVNLTTGEKTFSLKDRNVRSAWVLGGSTKELMVWTELDRNFVDVDFFRFSPGDAAGVVDLSEHFPHGSVENPDGLEHALYSFMVAVFPSAGVILGKDFGGEEVRPDEFEEGASLFVFDLEANRRTEELQNSPHWWTHPVRSLGPLFGPGTNFFILDETNFDPDLDESVRRISLYSLRPLRRYNGFTGLGSLQEVVPGRDDSERILKFFSGGDVRFYSIRIAANPQIHLSEPVLLRELPDTGRDVFAEWRGDTLFWKDSESSSIMINRNAFVSNDSMPALETRKPSFWFAVSPDGETIITWGKGGAIAVYSQEGGEYSLTRRYRVTRKSIEEMD